MRGLATALAGLLVCSCGSSGGASPPDAAGDGGDAGPALVVVMETSMGSMVARLDPDHMPITTANFMHYVDEHFYDGTLVHRVVDNWVIQGGGYTPGLIPKSPDTAPIPLETSPYDSHINGAISMAHTSDPNSATTQWFLVDWPTSGTPPQPAQLDGRYAAFGVLIEGFDVLQQISMVATTTRDGLDNVPVTDVVVTSLSRRSQ
jgi:cyclophilin family peptidyl-prolyl cis-trans isomerase